MARCKAPPKPNPTHESFKPKKKFKGSYFRRLNDIELGLKKIDVSKMPSGGKFLFLYYGCEKLGKGIIGIDAQWEAEDAYEEALVLDKLKAAAKSMKLPIPEAELDTVFLSNSKSSARYWRNEIAHNFGPSNVENVVEHSTKLNKAMHDFLETWTPPVLAFLKAHYSHLL